MKDKLQEGMIKALDILIRVNELAEIRAQKVTAVQNQNYKHAANLRDAELRLMENPPTITELYEIRNSIS